MIHNREPLEFKIVERKVHKHKSLFGRTLVELILIANKPIPPATHGTVCLKGKQY